MSTCHIYMSGSTRVHKHSRHHCMPEYGSESWTLHVYACICICKAFERCLLIALSVMKVIEVDFIVVWLFYSFNDIFISSWVYKIFVRIVWIAWWLSQQLRPCRSCNTKPCYPSWAWFDCFSFISHTGYFFFYHLFHSGGCIDNRSTSNPDPLATPTP